MKLPEPSPDVIDAIDNAIEWFKASKISGLNIETIPIDPVRLEGFIATIDRLEVKD